MEEGTLHRMRMQLRELEDLERSIAAGWEGEAARHFLRRCTQMRERLEQTTIRLAQADEMSRRPSHDGREE